MLTIGIGVETDSRCISGFFLFFFVLFIVLGSVVNSDIFIGFPILVFVTFGLIVFGGWLIDHIQTLFRSCQRGCRRGCQSGCQRLLTCVKKPRTTWPTGQRWENEETSEQIPRVIVVADPQAPQNFVAESLFMAADGQTDIPQDQAKDVTVPRPKWVTFDDTSEQILRVTNLADPWTPQSLVTADGPRDTPPDQTKGIFANAIISGVNDGRRIISGDENTSVITVTGKKWVAFEDTSEKMRVTAVADPWPPQSLVPDTLPVTADGPRDIPPDQTKNRFVNDTFSRVNDGRRITSGDEDTSGVSVDGKNWVAFEDTSEQMRVTAVADLWPPQSLVADTLPVTTAERDTAPDQTNDRFVNAVFSGVINGRRITSEDEDTSVVTVTGTKSATFEDETRDGITHNTRSGVSSERSITSRDSATSEQSP